MKTIKIDDLSYEILKKYCNKIGLKITRFVSNMIVEYIEKKDGIKINKKMSESK